MIIDKNNKINTTPFLLQEQGSSFTKRISIWMKLRMFTSLSTSGSTSGSKSKSKSKSLTSSASSSASAILIFLVASQFLTNSNVVNAFVIGSSRSARIRINAVADQRGPLMKLKHQSYHASYSQSLSLVNDKRKSSSSSSSRNVLVLKLSSDINNNKDDDDDDKTKKEPVEDYDNFDYTPFLEGKKVQSSSSDTDTDTDAAVTTDVVDSMPLSSSSLSSLSSSSLKDNINNDNDNSNVLTLDESIQTRYACTRYKRYDGNYTSDRNPSVSNPDVLKKARSALQLAIRSPSGFNVQPYKMLMINTPSAKLKLSKYCIGRNIDRVLDSDCTVIFLADRQAMRTWKQYKSMIEDSSSPQPTSSAKAANKTKTKTKLNWLKLRILIGLFSSGYPYIPKIIAGPISWFVRTAMRIVSWFTRSWLVVPTLSSSECWSQKNTALVAMSYMLVCTSKQLVTTPMEGYLSWGIRQSFNISRRYTIPLIVSTGTPYSADTDTNDENDDTGISHGNTKETSTPRFSYDSIIYEK